MTTKVILGRNCKLYYNTGSFGTPTWTVVKSVRDVTLTGTLGEADCSNRDKAVKMSEPTLDEIELTFEQVRDALSTIQTALLTAKKNRTAIDFAVSEGDITVPGTRYFRSDMKCFQGDSPQPLEGAATIPWKWKPCFSENPSDFYDVPTPPE